MFGKKRINNLFSLSLSFSFHSLEIYVLMLPVIAHNYNKIYDQNIRASTLFRLVYWNHRSSYQRVLTFRDLKITIFPSTLILILESSLKSSSRP